MTRPPEDKPAARTIPGPLKIAAMVLAAGSVLSVLAIIVIVMRSELQHRESICPFETLSTQQIAPGISVHEQARSCDENTAERRFWLHRPDAQPKLLGGRRLPKEHYDKGRFRWSADESERGVVITLENDGVAAAKFYELPPKRKGHPSP